MTDTLLKIDNLTMQFGGLIAVNDVSFSAKRGNITAVIGPNGAGKTTLFNCLTGFYKPTSGKMVLDDKWKLHKMAGDAIAGTAGVARTFQNIRLFAGMTALENLLVAQNRFLSKASHFSIAGLLGLPSYKKAEKEAISFALEWLERVGLIDKADWLAANLPYGDQRKLEIARAMCTRPTLLCLDEPAAGLNPKESAELNHLLISLKEKEGVSMLLIEHDMRVVMEISDHIVVLEYGQKIADGTPEDIRNDENVIRAYLGEPDEESAAS